MGTSQTWFQYASQMMSKVLRCYFVILQYFPNRSEDSGRVQRLSPQRGRRNLCQQTKSTGHVLEVRGNSFLHRRVERAKQLGGSNLMERTKHTSDVRTSRETCLENAGSIKQKVRLGDLYDRA